jgi:predicted RNase H-like nuclease
MSYTPSVRVIGIDVAPAKGGHIYKGGDSVDSKCPKCLSEFLDGMQDDVLIAWDAPLTACTDPDGELIKSDLTQRIIEKFFSTGTYQTPKGVSVRPYSECSHWTISRRMLGLPRIGPHDSAVGLPFTLSVRDDARPKAGRNIVEVHPALALWLWFRDERPESSWTYKESRSTTAAKARQTRGEIWTLLSSRFRSVLRQDLRFARGAVVPNDDELDAVSAWLLARCWVFQEKVSLLGDIQTGALLLPRDEVLQQEFQRFRDTQLSLRLPPECRKPL